MLNPWLQLVDLCQGASRELVLAAPFIKEAVLRRLLENIHTGVRLLCITRWRPAEIKVGVSDITVWDVLQDHDNAQLYLRADLHAKYYRADDKCLIGSANLTATALGWTKQANLEILVRMGASSQALTHFEARMFAGATKVDASMVELITKAVDLLDEESLEIVRQEEVSDSLISFDELHYSISGTENWLPTLRQPENLYQAYTGREEELTAGARKAAISDLAILKPPSKLSDLAFKGVIGATLLQMPIVSKVDSFVRKPRRFGAVKHFITTLLGDQSQDFDIEIGWQTLIRWLLYFLPGRYNRTVPRHSEIFCRLTPNCETSIED